MPSGKPQGRAHGFGKRDTHFLCLPLVTSESVPQLAASLARFRDVSTASTTATTTGQSTADDNNGVVVRDEHDETATSVSSNGHCGPNLRVIPGVAHRPPGTFHLTLGVMDLSSEDAMQRALRLLKTIDYRRILREVSNGATTELASRGVYEWISRTSLSTSNPTLAAKQTRGDARGREPNSQTQNQTLRTSESQLRTATEQDEDMRTPVQPLTIKLGGLSTFPDVKAARVFYAIPFDATERLQTFAQAVRRIFRSAGLITETRPLVLHATVANLRYAIQQVSRGPKSVGGGTDGGKRGKRAGNNETGVVDARDLVAIFNAHAGNVDGFVADRHDDEKITGVDVVESTKTSEEFVWAQDVAVDRVAICKLGATKSEDPVWGLEYPPIDVKMILDETTHSV